MGAWVAADPAWVNADLWHFLRLPSSFLVITRVSEWVNAARPNWGASH